MVKKLIAILSLIVLVVSASIQVEWLINNVEITQNILETDGDFEKFVEESKKVEF